jgi:hypothetical protein
MSSVRTNLERELLSFRWIFICLSVFRPSVGVLVLDLAVSYPLVCLSDRMLQYNINL